MQTSLRRLAVRFFASYYCIGGIAFHRWSWSWEWLWWFEPFDFTDFGKSCDICSQCLHELFPEGFPHLRLGGPLRQIVHLLLPLSQRHRFQPTLFHLRLVSSTNCHNLLIFFGKLAKFLNSWTLCQPTLKKYYRWFNVDCAASEALYSLNSEIAAQVSVSHNHN